MKTHTTDSLCPLSVCPSWFTGQAPVYRLPRETVCLSTLMWATLVVWAACAAISVWFYFQPPVNAREGAKGATAVERSLP